MTTTVQNDDTSDLLILSDEPTTPLEESPVIEENSTTMDDLITFGDDLTTDTPTEELAPVMEVKEEESLGMGLDLTTDTETTEELTPVMEVKEEESLGMGLDLTTDTETTEELTPVMEVKKENNVFSLEEATTSYILQLEGRKKQISNDISDDEKIISIKEEKIKNLRSEITDYKKSIKELNEETSEIDKNIGLVSGKSKAESIKSSTSTRVHNAKRKKAV